MQQYEKYKDSGIDWIGEIPEAWRILPGLSFIYENKVKNKGMIRNTVLSLSYGKIRVKAESELTGLVPESFETYQLVNVGDLIFRPTDLQNDMVSLRSSISEFEGIITSAYLNLRFKENADPKFFHYFFRSIDNNKIIYGLGSGLRQNISYIDFRRFNFPFPPIEEQQTIATFLDDKTAKIDQMIAIKQKEIELLKERLQIFIQKAVTKGLDDAVKLKDSGVEWIGEIPRHWELRKLKYVVYMQSGETITAESFTDEGYAVMGGNGFRGYTNRYTNEGDFILIGRQGALCGNVNYANGKFFATEHAIVVYPNKEVLDILWLGEVIKLADLNKLSQTAAQPGISVTQIKNVIIPFIPQTEQLQIVSYIKQTEEKIIKAISLKQQEIEKLKEYKMVLIDNVVTGKMKVS